jgi:putative redox protein
MNKNLLIMKRQKVHFQNDSSKKLSAVIEFPIDKKPYTYAIFAHCFTCNKNLHAVVNITHALTSRGIAVFRFDFTGLGESEGDFSDTNFSSNVDDLVAAAKYLEKNYEAPSMLVGHSLGGAAVIYAANRLNHIKAIATIGAPSDPEHVSKLIKEGREEIEEKGEATVNIGGRPFKIKKQFLDDLRNKRPEEIIIDLKKPILILHSPFDKIVSIDNAAEIYQAAFHPKSFISLDDADHLLSKKKDSVYAGNVIATWMSRFVEIAEPKELETDKEMVARITGDDLTVDLQAGKHRLTADEPESAGGNNFGPTPYELLNSALGSCTAMTLKLYADRKRWPLEEVLVHIEHERVHKDDCDGCEKSEGNRISVFKRSIEIIGDLSMEQKKRMIEIANKCPVHKTLTNKIEINTKLVHT